MSVGASLQEYQLSVPEAVMLSAAQSWMIAADVAASDAKSLAAKGETQQEHREALVKALTDLVPEDTDFQPWEVSNFAGDGWVLHFASAVQSLPDAARPLRLEAATTIPVVLSNIDSRSRALLLLIELYAFHPWASEVIWHKQARRKALQWLTLCLPGVAQDDLDAVSREFDSAMKELSRDNRAWRRVLALSALGVGLGVLTAGLAAPLIGGIIGGAMGLSGAAATSAGLAALGGGSLAAGGAGMAGGTALLAGLGGVAGVGVGGTGGRLSGWTSGQVVMETVKLRVLTKLIIVDEQHDDAKRRLVVQSLELRLRQVVERFEELECEIAHLRTENRELRKKREGERDDLELAKAGLEQAIDELGSPQFALA